MPIDILVSIVVLVVSFFAIIYFGKSVGVSAILSLYPSLLIYENFVFLDKVLGFARSPFEAVLVKSAIFTLILLVVYIMMRRAVSVVFSWTPAVKLIEGVILAIVLTGLIFSSYTYVSGTTYLIKNIPLNYLFNTASFTLFWWLSGAIIVLLFILRK